MFQSSIIAQLIRRVYVVYPTWTFNGSIVYTSGTGITNATGLQQVCLCMDAEEGDCMTRDRSAKDPVPSEIPAPDCDRRWNYTHLELSSSTAPGVLRASKKYALPKTREHPLILDIDEDFFGVQLVGHDLLREGISEYEYEMVNWVLESLFCPKFAGDEARVDSWFRRHLKTPKACSRDPANLSRPFCSEQRANRTICSPRSLEASFARIPAVCPESKPVFEVLNRLLSNMTLPQLNAFERVGVCFNMAWRTYAFQPHLRLCLGHNQPGHSVVPQHVPQLEEMVALAKNFTRVLRALPRQPDVITVARSARDGYVARWLQQTVEKFIITSVKKVFGLRTTDIHFSDYLAGGKDGWYNSF